MEELASIPTDHLVVEKSRFGYLYHFHGRTAIDLEYDIRSKAINYARLVHT